MKTIGSIIGAFAFLMGAGLALVAITDFDGATTLAVAEGAVGTAFLVLGVGILLSQQLNEIKDHLAYQNKLLIDITESSRETAGALEKLSQRRKK